jgi:hypothetical protein
MSINNWTEEDLQKLQKLKAAGQTWHQIAVSLERSDTAVRVKHKKLFGAVPSLAETEIPTTQPAVELPRPSFGHLPLSVVDSGGWIRLGLVADTHLCCKEERLAELHTQYDLFKKEGITNVLHAGNPIDGYVARINGESVFETTIDGQANYFASNYPQRDGIQTYFITGDDHESWFAPGFNIGAYLQLVAEKMGRTDLVYIGHVEADIDIRPPGSKVPTIIKLQHPGGGSAYARSYTGQKQVEAFEGGEKPAILIQGHYHVSNHMVERNIHVVSMPGFQDQTIFARKKRLRMEVGGAILEFKVNPNDGAVTRCRVEFNHYFTRGYYKRFIKSDVRLIKGRLTLS